MQPWLRKCGTVEVQNNFPLEACNAAYLQLSTYKIWTLVVKRWIAKTNPPWNQSILRILLENDTKKSKLVKILSMIKTSKSLAWLWSLVKKDSRLPWEKLFQLDWKKLPLITVCCEDFKQNSNYFQWDLQRVREHGHGTGPQAS